MTTKNQIRCGMVGGDGVFYIGHSGNCRLSYNKSTPNRGLYECQGCGKFYSRAEVQKLRAGK